MTIPLLSRSNSIFSVFQTEKTNSLGEKGYGHQLIPTGPAEKVDISFGLKRESEHFLWPRTGDFLRKSQLGHGETSAFQEKQQDQPSDKI